MNEFIKAFVDYDATYEGENSVISVVCDDPITAGEFVQLKTSDGRFLNIGFTAAIDIQIGDELHVSVETGELLKTLRRGHNVQET